MSISHRLPNERDPEYYHTSYNALKKFLQIEVFVAERYLGVPHLPQNQAKRVYIRFRVISFLFLCWKTTLISTATFGRINAILPIISGAM